MKKLLAHGLLACTLLTLFSGPIRLLHAAPLPHPARQADDPAPAPAVQIRYVLSMPQPQTHYFEVEMRLQNAAKATEAIKSGYYDLKMPVWTPGSYLIREYAKNVEAFTAQTGTQPLRSEKVNKNTWRIYTKADDLTVRYRVYSYEFSVRNSFLDDTHGYLNGASIFLYSNALKNNSLQVQVVPFTGWKKVATGMKAVPNAEFTFEAPNYDILVDSPMEIGNHETITFTATNVPHTVAMYGNVQYDAAKLAADYKRVCETAATVVGEHPCTDYTFIVHHTNVGGGGLEHLNSTTLQTNRVAYASEANYKGFLTLVAHEYFHLWNVKRIRPIALGPFDYETENYTHMLWLSEGCTSFYEDYIMRRAGFHTPEEYLRVVAGDISGVENAPGNRVQSAAESSFDAWIKYYRPNENSANSTVSYYSKGAVLGSLLNLAILASTDGQRSMDDLMRYLYGEYYKKQKRGFTDDEFRKAAEQIAGKPLADFFDNGVNGTGPLNYNAYFAPVGLRLVNGAETPEARLQQGGFLGAAARTNGATNRATVTSVRRGSAAELAGLNVGDEILAIDGTSLTEDLAKTLAGRKAGERLKIGVNRGGIPREFTAQLTDSPLYGYRLEPLANASDKQKALYNRWLYVK